MDPHSEVTRALARLGIRFEAHPHAPVRNVHEARAAGLPFDPRVLTKTLVFRLPDRFVLAWVAALDRLDYAALARACRENRRRVRYASDDEVTSVLGWEPGGAAPLPPTAGVELVVDERVALMPVALCGGGRRDLTVELAPRELLARVAHVLAPLVAEPPLSDPRSSDSGR